MAEKQAKTGGNAQILVVDDDLELCHVIVDTLNERGYQSSFVQNAEEGYDLILQKTPDIVLLDLEIPHMGGFVLCQKLRANASTRRLPIIFLTVRDSDFDKRTAISLGANRYITKPFRRSHLLKEVEMLLTEQSQAQAEDWIGPSPGMEKKTSPPPPAAPERAGTPPPQVADARAVRTAPPAPPEPVKTETVPKPEPALPAASAAPAAPAAEKAAKPPMNLQDFLPSSSSPKAEPAPPRPAKKAEAPPPPTAPQPASAPAPLGTKPKEKRFESFDSFRKESSFKIKAEKFKQFFMANKKTSLAIASVVIVGLMWGSVAFFKKGKVDGKQEKEGAAGEDVIISVNVQKVALAPFQDILTAVGTVAGGSEIELRFQTEGKIRSLNFREGDKARAGQVIAQLDQTQLLIKLERARSEFYRYEKLYALGGISKDRLDEARVQFEYAESEMDKTVLRAPKEGIFGDRGVEVGEFVTPQKKVGTLVSLDTVLVRIGVIEKEIDKIFPGQIVTCTVDTYPNVEFKGKVENISPLVQGQSKTLTVEARMPNEGSLLLPGMFARTKIIIYEKDSVISVPNDTLEKKADGYKVYVVGENSKAVERSVEVSYVSLSNSVISSGLSPGEQIIVQKPQELKNGSPIKIVDVEKSQGGEGEEEKQF